MDTGFGLSPLAHIKKPISGKSGIGAQFVSFNFPNSLIWRWVSSCAISKRHTASRAREGCDPLVWS
jgi:hypothetical protein